MAPNLLGNTATLFLEATQQDVRQSKPTEPAVPSASNNLAKKLGPKEPNYEWKIVWRNVIAFVYLHVGALYGFYLFFAGAKFLTLLWSELSLIFFTTRSTRVKNKIITFLFPNFFIMYHYSNVDCGSWCDRSYCWCSSSMGS